MSLDRRALLLGLAAFAAAPARAHHGYMVWDTENPVALEGWISKELDGFPHWEIWMRVEGEDWEVDVGDQFTLKKAGLSEDGKEFKMRRELRIDGLRPVDRSVLRILPRRITFLDSGESFEIEVNG